MKLFEFLSEATSSSNIYTVKSGDSLLRIIKDNDTTMDGLMWQNPQFTKPEEIGVGSRLRMPGSNSSTDNNQPARVSGKTSPEFNKKLQQIADQLGINFNDLYKIIQTESNFNPAAEDPKHVSVGLIGFTEPTAKQLGTSKAELVQMSAEDQLDYVYRFYKMVGAKPGDNVATLYMRTFMPAFVNSPDNTVLGQKGGGLLMLPNGKSSGLSLDKVWEQNPLFGKSQGKDFFTVGDVKNTINSR
jgi:LysM repeat protein